MPEPTPLVLRTSHPPWAVRDGVTYGALGAPLAFVALPLYVQWPAFAAENLGLSLAVVGGLLLGMRGVDALIDPWLGAQVDRRFTQGAPGVWRLMAVACVLVAVGFAWLFLPPSFATTSTLRATTWSLIGLIVTYLGFSVAQIGHQAWGARLGGDAPYRARVVGAREVFALLGVMVASVLPSQAGWGITALTLTLLLLISMALLRHAPTACTPLRSTLGGPTPPSAQPTSALGLPWQHREFRRLVLVYLANGMASAIPATLVLFYVRDRLQLPTYEALFLLAYFAAAALSVPWWAKVVARLGLVHAWAAGMALAMVAFVFAAGLDAGDAWGFAAVCVGTGFALGADLLAPAALLTGVIQRAGVSQHAEGVWFGWWNLCTKLNLALAAGVALPLLQWMGYERGDRSTNGLTALVVIYAVLPCVVKGVALLILLRTRWHEAPMHPGGSSDERPARRPRDIP